MKKHKIKKCFHVELNPDTRRLKLMLVSCDQGTAVFWYNLHRSGEGDYRTRHAACPVLVGNKWGESTFLHSVCLVHRQNPDRSSLTSPGGSRTGRRNPEVGQKGFLTRVSPPNSTAWMWLYPSTAGGHKCSCPRLPPAVSNKWIHERGQEFRRRCGLQLSE